MNLQQVFSYEGNEIRVVMKNEEPWWIAKDVCDVLTISNSRDALKKLDEDEKGVVSTDTLGGRQELAAVNESGLYTLILGSRKQEAKSFKRWITHDVIPSIRKTGKYEIEQQPKSSAELMLMYAQQFVEQEKRLIEVENRINKNENKVVQITTYLTDTPERSKINRKIEELARTHHKGDKQDATNELYAVIKDKCGFDVHKRVDNKRKQIQNERIASGKNAYKASTLKTKATGMDILEEHNMLEEVMEILIGLIARENIH